ncbi:hypothetical protein GO730_24340 [Spirosoma sp. HMF3257]|uniref:SH3 domain-containing protein n=1 Tax=Spirosoma telluris TaxID=2183553 RepID=A0A327NNY8_9BACT|nr:hypothetical protein [Spirosoma telluris]RAI76503.1 hypothetical protein HMF3257_24285 [Spirosoma telluris]
MKIGFLILLFLTRNALAQSDTLLSRYQLRYPLSKAVLAEAPLKIKPIITSETLLTIPANAQVIITQKDREFYKVVYNNRAGYVPYIFLEKDYETFKRRNYPHKPIEEGSNELAVHFPIDSTTWYGRISVQCPIRKEPNSGSENLFNLPKGTIVKMRRHDYSYWQIELGGHIYYAGVHYIGDISTSVNPFVPTRYTGPTYDRYEAVTRDSTRQHQPSSVGSGRSVINQPGNKTPIQRKK